MWSVRMKLLILIQISVRPRVVIMVVVRVKQPLFLTPKPVWLRELKDTCHIL